MPSNKEIDGNSTNTSQDKCLEEGKLNKEYVMKKNKKNQF
jgi:hypothetical protein